MVRATKDLLDKFDYPTGCPICEAVRRGDGWQTVHHSKECRQRIEDIMMDDSELRGKLSEVEERQSRWIGHRIEAQDAKGTPAPAMEQGLVASALTATMSSEYELDELPVGSPMGSSGQGGE